ncbi:hypothetical protein MTR_1g041225 [Medicago truncatula]|uniref:Uncharacterized protein n=1 Tax=Medicago truncatula TaxID=3880 RepID=A0A072VHE6_MEDTR|nr:hypothetical protein MTR_1g041225 [Medicago truncatula]
MDGCFLKRYHGGLILAVIGRDLNDQMLPRPFAIVEGKTKDSWSLFLEPLINDLVLEKRFLGKKLKEVMRRHGKAISKCMGKGDKRKSNKLMKMLSSSLSKYDQDIGVNHGSYLIQSVIHL